MLAFEFSTCEFGEYICLYILSSWDVLDVHPVKTGLHDVVDQVIVLEESCVFNLKLIIEVANSELGIYSAY